MKKRAVEILSSNDKNQKLSRIDQRSAESSRNLQLSDSIALTFNDVNYYTDEVRYVPSAHLHKLIW